MLRSAIVGLMLGLISFAVSGWIVYSLLWWYTGQVAIQRNGGTPGVVLGCVWCFGVGAISCTVIGVLTAVLTTLYFHRRQHRGKQGAQQSA